MNVALNNPPFSIVAKDLLLYLGLAFITVGLAQTIYCFARMKQLERKFKN